MRSYLGILVVVVLLVFKVAAASNSNRSLKMNRTLILALLLISLTSVMAQFLAAPMPLSVGNNVGVGDSSFASLVLACSDCGGRQG
jgi:hypothetical protein